MSVGPEAGSQGGRIEVSLDSALADRLGLLRDLVEASSLPPATKQNYLSLLTTETIIDEAVTGFLDGITEELDTLFPNT